jgi:uncharacterized repeat protein (TIGR03803 family)
MTLGAALATPVRLAAQEQEQQRLETRQQYSVTDLGTVMALPAQNEQDPNTVVKFSNLIDFDFTNGWFPPAGLVQGTDGDLYGATVVGGANTIDTTCFGGGVGCSTIFKITPGGTLTTLYNFCSQTNCADGGNPGARLVLGTDGNFYGITEDGGANGFGTAFKITPGGTLSTLYNWCSQPNCADGNYTFLQNPGTFVEATDGNFYGANNGPGAGTVFKLTPSGALTTLHTFGTQSGDGSLPSGLIQATDGNFYGTTLTGGTTLGGTVFKITPSGTLTTLYTFCSQT